MAKAPAKPTITSKIETPAPHAEPARRFSKRDHAIGLMQRPVGATMKELTAATGWLPHSTRAIISGLRKDGYAVTRSRRDDSTCYTIGETK